MKGRKRTKIKLSRQYKATFSNRLLRLPWAVLPYYHAGRKEVTKIGIHWIQMRKHASKGYTPALKPKADVTRSPKQRYQWPHKKDWRAPKIFLWNKNSTIFLGLFTCLCSLLQASIVVQGCSRHHCCLLSVSSNNFNPLWIESAETIIKEMKIIFWRSAILGVSVSASFLIKLLFSPFVF